MESKDSKIDSRLPPNPVNLNEGGTSGELTDCCVVTIKKHVQFNPMMVCDGCKQIIKCFKEEAKFRNYLTFCQSRRRKVHTGFAHGYHTVVFKSYDTYS